MPSSAPNDHPHPLTIQKHNLFFLTRYGSLYSIVLYMFNIVIQPPMHKA